MEGADKVIDTAEAIRSEVEQHLGYSVPDETWDYLVEKKYVEDVLVGAETIVWLAQEAQAVLRAGGQPVGSRPQVAPMRSHGSDAGEKLGPGYRKKRLARRVDAVSVLLAGDAREQKGVQAFRNDALANGLLSLEEVEGWILHQAERDGPHTRWLRVPIPEGHKVSVARGYLVPTPAISVSDNHPAEWASPQYLAYGVPTDRWLRRIPVARDGVLGRLHVLSRSLAHRYGWQESQAALFVLTDIVPLVSHLRTGFSLKAPFRALSRVTLTIDPALSPREVADAYGKVRHQILGSRFRHLNEEHTQLALFIAERPEGETWKQRLEAWNEAHPESSYTTESNFARDCIQAQRRLIDPPYTAPLGQD
jgi:hypothetical protein